MSAAILPCLPNRKYEIIQITTKWFINRIHHSLTWQFNSNNNFVRDSEMHASHARYAICWLCLDLGMCGFRAMTEPHTQKNNESKKWRARHESVSDEWMKSDQKIDPRRGRLNEMRSINYCHYNADAIRVWCESRAHICSTYAQTKKFIIQE